MKTSPIVFLLFFAVLIPGRAQTPAAAEILSAMKKAAQYYHGTVACRGGYVYYYSPDLSRRLGEGVAEPDQIWVQPPGTPTVGAAFLDAYAATNDAFYLAAATAAAEALIHGQLQSGAWTNAIDFNPRGSRADRYRNGKGKGKNFSTLDDDISQAALSFLMRLDQTTEFKNPAVHDACAVALDALFGAQFPNGAFPQGWDESPAAPGAAKDLRANFPAYDWRTEGRIKEYWDMYNLNDGISLTVAETLLEARRIYGREDCDEGLRRLGDFLILAQMPKPQPGWAQQYNYDMQPIWARKFEPPAVSGRETEEVIGALLKIASHTRDKKYLAPIPDAMKWLKDSLLPDGKLARYYELETNRPLYMFRKGKQYSLTYDDSDLPSHYGWKSQPRLAALQAAWDALFQGKDLAAWELPPLYPEPEPSPEEVLASLDDQGRWISTFQGEPLVGQPEFREGESYLSSALFSRNLRILCGALKGND